MIEDNNINDQTTVNYDEGNIQTLTGLNISVFVLVCI